MTFDIIDIGCDLMFLMAACLNWELQKRGFSGNWDEFIYPMTSYDLKYSVWVIFTTFMVFFWSFLELYTCGHDNLSLEKSLLKILQHFIPEGIYFWLFKFKVQLLTELQRLTFPQPGTSTPSTGLGISIERTVPYLQHSSRMSSRISS